MEEHEIDRWYLEGARYFRALGFFSRYSELAPEEMAARLKENVTRVWDEPFPPGAEDDPQCAEMCMLATDTERVWHSDLECVYPGEHAYVRFLEGLAAISGGAFKPRDITEKWNGERGPVEVRFTVDGEICQFLHTGGDMLDPAILRTVNRSIQASGVAFEVCDNLGMPNFIVALTRDHKNRLAARGWKFWPGT